MCLTTSCVGSPGPDQGGNAGLGSPSIPGEAWSRDGAGRLAGQNGPWSPSPSLGPPHPACKPGAFPKVTLPPEALLIATAGSNHRPRMFPRGAWGKRKPRAGRPGWVRGRAQGAMWAGQGALPRAHPTAAGRGPSSSSSSVSCSGKARQPVPAPPRAPFLPLPLHRLPRPQLLTRLPGLQATGPVSLGPRLPCGAPCLRARVRGSWARALPDSASPPNSVCPALPSESRPHSRACPLLDSS